MVQMAKGRQDGHEKSVREKWPINGPWPRGFVSEASAVSAQVQSGNELCAFKETNTVECFNLICGRAFRLSPLSFHVFARSDTVLDLVRALAVFTRKLHVSNRSDFVPLSRRHTGKDRQNENGVLARTTWLDKTALLPRLKHKTRARRTDRVLRKATEDSYYVRKENSKQR